MVESNENHSSSEKYDVKLKLNKKDQTLNTFPENNTLLLSEMIIRVVVFHVLITDTKYCLVTYIKT